MVVKDKRLRFLRSPAGKPHVKFVTRQEKSLRVITMLQAILGLSFVIRDVFTVVLSKMIMRRHNASHK